VSGWDRREVENFLYREAQLMDEHRFKDWEALWTDDAVYWVPCNEDDIDPATQVSIIYDDRTGIATRVSRLTSGLAHMHDPKPRMTRVISNVLVLDENDQELTVLSNFVLIELRRHIQNIWAGRTTHRLRRDGGEPRIAYKKVCLFNNDEELPNLSFLI
jgi:benzoate/toluate 1,2-dioxygenase beta subunit